MAGLCVGIIAGISTTAVLSEIQTPVSTPVAAQVRASTEKPAAAAVAMLTQASVAARPATSQAASKLPAITSPRGAETAGNDEPIASTDGRGGGASIDRGAVVPETPAGAPPPAALAASTPAVTPPAVTPPAATPLVAPAVAATVAPQPAVQTGEPAAKPVSHPQRVVQKRQKKPTSYSRNQNPFFPFFGGNGLFFGGSRG